MGLMVMVGRSRVSQIILLLVLLVIVLQVFHMSLLTRLEAKEALDRFKLPATHLGGPPLLSLVQAVEERVRNSHRLDHSGTYHIIANILHEGQTDSLNERDHVEDVAIVTQSSSNHLHHVTHLVEAWGGPISLAVFTFDTDVENALQKIVQLYTCNQKIRKLVTFHLVYPLNRPPAVLSTSWMKVTCGRTIADDNVSANYAIRGIEYPHNLLRNLAIKYSTSRYIFMIDIDMIPSANVRNEFLKMVSSLKHSRENSTQVINTAFIVPAFEVMEKEPMPKSKSALLVEWTAGSVRPFYRTVCWKCQRHTDYEKWRELQQTTGLHVAYRVGWKDPWEPFFIGSKWMPPYDERFKQYGFNRISQVCELHVHGYEFGVLDSAFLVHRGFKQQEGFHSTKQQEMERNVQLFRRFKEELKTKYPNSTRRCY